MNKRAAYILPLAFISASCFHEPKGLSRDYRTVKAEFERVCTKCHTLDPVLRKNRSVEEWKETVERMKMRGAKVEEWMVGDFAIHLAHIRPPK